MPGPFCVSDPAPVMPERSDSAVPLAGVKVASEASVTARPDVKEPVVDNAPPAKVKPLAASPRLASEAT